MFNKSSYLLLVYTEASAYLKSGTGHQKESFGMKVKEVCMDVHVLQLYP